MPLLRVREERDSRPLTSELSAGVAPVT
jgi:hypothetical protein